MSQKEAAYWLIAIATTIFATYNGFNYQSFPTMVSALGWAFGTWLAGIAIGIVIALICVLFKQQFWYSFIPAMITMTALITAIQFFGR